MCPILMSVLDSSSKYTCERSTQVKEVLSLVAELLEKVSRLSRSGSPKQRDRLLEPHSIFPGVGLSIRQDA